jgi:hypothetical protein
MTLSLFFALYCLEAGLFFLLAPWTRFWGASPLFQHSEAIAAFLTDPYIRGLFSGFGLVHLLLGSREIFQMIRRRGHAG